MNDIFAPILRTYIKGGKVSWLSKRRKIVIFYGYLNKKFSLTPKFSIRKKISNARFVARSAICDLLAS